MSAHMPWHLQTSRWNTARISVPGGACVPTGGACVPTSCGSTKHAKVAQRGVATLYRTEDSQGAPPLSDCLFIYVYAASTGI